MPFTMSKCAKGAEKRKADDADLASSQAAPKVPKVSEIKVEAPLARPRNPRSRPISAPVQVSFYKYSKNAGLSLSILFTSLSVAQRDLGNLKEWWGNYVPPPKIRVSNLSAGQGYL